MIMQSAAYTDMKSVWAEVLPPWSRAFFLNPSSSVHSNFSVTLGKELNFSELRFLVCKMMGSSRNQCSVTWAFRVRAVRDLWGSTLWKYHTEEGKILRIKLPGVQTASTSSHLSDLGSFISVSFSTLVWSCLK